ncbi:MAG TPA: MFS transporter [Candidatus Aminicenantes bacterium]|nr:MFS transporter [Candidatus Aminicenantes bacterium]
MTEKIKQSLRDSATARWTALATVSLTMLCGYYLADVMAPLKPMLESQLHWTSSEYGFFTSAYGWFNVFLLMLIIGGIILDKMGVRFTGITAAAVMVVGAGLKYWAINTTFPEGATLLGWKPQIIFAAVGFAIFGVGVEVAGITVSKTIVRWFKGKELALAMGLQLATARMGTALALVISAPIAAAFGTPSAPLLLGLILLCIGLIAFIVYGFMDRKLDASELNPDGTRNQDEESFRLRDIGSILTNRAFWYIAALCLLFYSAVFPFLKFANDLMVQKYFVKATLAGLIPGLLPFGNIFMTPLFGRMVDRKGKAASIMFLGSAMLIVVHLLFALPLLNNWIFALFLMLILGVAFSLVPSAMWPSVPKLIPQKQLGTAFSLIFFIQNWGLMGVPYLIGWILDRFCVVARTTLPDGTVAVVYNYTLPMLVFAGFGVLGMVFAYLLKREDRRKGYGLELPSAHQNA